MKMPSRECKKCKNYAACIQAAYELFEELTLEVFSE